MVLAGDGWRKCGGDADNGAGNMTAPSDNQSTAHLLAPLDVPSLVKIINACLKGKGRNKNTVLVSHQNLPSMLHHLTRLREMDQGRIGWLTEHLEQCEAISGALELLRRLIPQHRPFYETDLRMAVGAVQYVANFPQFADEIQGADSRAAHRLEVLNELEDVVVRAMAAGLPMRSVEVIAPDYIARHSQRFRWRGYVDAVNDSFHQIIPDRTKEDGYRFVQAVLPHITGDRPSIDNIKQALKEARRATWEEVKH